LSDNISLIDTLNLTLPDHIHRFKASEGETSRVEEPKSQSWFGESFNGAVTLLDNIVQIFDHLFSSLGR
jgi:hypothetical protein